MRTSILLTILLSLVSAGCKQSSDGTANAAATGATPGTATAAEGPDATERAVSKKLDDAIYCINVTSSAIRRAREQYARHVDPAKGPEPKGKIYVGRHDAKACLDRVTATLAVKPAVADLDAAITSYLAKLNEVLPTVNGAADYFEQDRHLDDGAAKGKELHPKLLAAFEAFAATDAALRVVVDKYSRAAREADLAAFAKDPAARGRYLRGRVLLIAEDLVKLTDAPALAKLDGAAFEAKTIELDKALAELTTYADSPAATSGGDEQRLAGSARYYVTAARALVRRIKDNTPYDESQLRDIANGRDHVDGSIPQVIAKYNDLIQTANSIR